MAYQVKEKKKSHRTSASRSNPSGET